MKLIKQTALWNNDGNADKVYEIDLCETAPGKYVVNFRYGRRGSTLKDGTKTAAAVGLEQAETIFKKLADEKRKGGYRDADSYTATPVTETVAATPSSTEVADKPAYVLKCLQEAVQPVPGKETKWPLGRIIWRAGQLRIVAAAPLIVPQLIKGNALLQYTACWSLGRCGSTTAISPLEQVYTSKATAPHVRRMALAALLALKKKDSSDKELLQQILNSLPDAAQTALQQNDAPALQTQLAEWVADYTLLDHTISVYLLADTYPAAETAIYQWLKTAPVVPNFFKVLRHLFKLAEFKEDAPVFTLLAHTFETNRGLFAYSIYDHNSYAYYNGKYYPHALDELKKPNAALAYSDTTHHYLSRRVWRTMQTFGKDGNETYIRYAFGVLLHYNGGLTGKPEPEERTQTFYSYNYTTRSYETRTVSKTFAAFAGSRLLNHILYANSRRYRLPRNRKWWQLQPGSPVGEPPEKEEAFPELWDQYPQALVQLLFDSEVEVVHRFAVKLLSTRSDVDSFFDTAALKQLLQKPFPVTAWLALRLAEKRYDAAAPDVELVAVLLQHPVAEARALAIQWIRDQPDYFFEKTEIPVYAIVNPYDDVFNATNHWLTGRTEDTLAAALVEKTVNRLWKLPADGSDAPAAAQHAVQLLTMHFMPVVLQQNTDAIARLLQHPLVPVQVFGAAVLLQYPLPVQQFPAGLLSSMIQAALPQVRQAGITLFGRLPRAELLSNAALIAAFCVSPYSEIRTTIQPVVQELAQSDAAFGAALLQDLLPYMQRRETTEGLQQHLYELFTTALATQLATVDEVTALAFIHSRFAAPQLLGLYILKNYDKASGLTMRQWIRMTDHEVVDIRQFAWTLFEKEVQRVKAEATESLRLLDVSWADSRAFAVGYFRTHFEAEDWTPTLLVSVCDSTRADVQSFGREMISRYFKEENGEQYLLQLSQHPAQQVQHFTTHYLEQFAADKPVNIEKLEAYFVTVLSSVNRAGIAKKRIFNFLQQEALKNETVAQLAAVIVARQSATMAVADKAACINILYYLHKKYPAIQMPLSVVPVEVR